MSAERDYQRVETKARSFWVLMILGFFAIDLSIAVIAITMAVADPSFRSIPGYGERAVAWDERRALNDAWQKQNWHIEVNRVGSHSDAIELVVTDADDRPVTGCIGSVNLFHFTRVAQQVIGKLNEVAAGRYRAKVDVAKPGLWNLELDLIASDGKHYFFEQHLEWNDSGGSE